MTSVDNKQLDEQIAEWRGYIRRREVSDGDIEELEDHLRTTIGDLIEGGLHPDEAFLIAVKRMGSLDELSREFAREHSGRLWKQLVLTGAPESQAAQGARTDLIAMIVCAGAAALAVHAPRLFGIDLDDGNFYARNVSLFVLGPLAAFFLWKRRAATWVLGVVAGFFALAAVGANIYPLDDNSQTLVLTAIHLPLALWFVVGLAYTGGDWRSERRRMDFIRFTGEFFVYFVLIGLGGGVLVAITFGTFEAIGLNPENFIGEWLLPSGFAGSVIVAAWLVEAKQSVIENIAPVLTRIFTPLFTAVMLAFLGAVILTRTGIDVQRDVLILFDLLLVVVLGLLLYSISARDPLTRPNLFDRLQFALVVSALLIDVLVLIAIAGRIAEYGGTPNKTAALGENVILATNLAWSAWLYWGFLRGRSPFTLLERWQTKYVMVYAIWAWAVVLLLPPAFNFA